MFNTKFKTFSLLLLFTAIFFTAFASPILRTNPDGTIIPNQPQFAPPLSCEQPIELTRGIRNIPASTVRTIHPRPAGSPANFRDQSNDQNRWVLTILGDGFTQAQQNDFFAFADWWTPLFLNTYPFSDYRDMISVHAVFVASATTGHPTNFPRSDAEATSANRTYFQGWISHGDWGSTNITATGLSRADALIARDVPHGNQAIMILNANAWAGAGGEIAVATISRDAGAGLVLHELGHSPRFAHLADEYDWIGMHDNGNWWRTGNTGNEGFANRTAWSNRNNPKWNALRDIDNVGVFQFSGGGTGNNIAANWGRPHQRCIMMSPSYTFCHVCAAAISRAMSHHGAGPERNTARVGPARGTTWPFYGGDRRELEREHGAGLVNAPTTITMPLPNGTTRMLNYAFWNHTRVATIILPDGLTHIGQWAFVGASSLTTITIPASVTSIPANAFHGMTNRQITIRGTRGSAAETFANRSDNSFVFQDIGGTQPTLHTVTLNANGGTVNPSSITQSSAGASITLPTPTRANHTFNGWRTATNCGGTLAGNAGASYTPPSNITLFACWQENAVVQRQVSVSHSAGGVVRNGTQNVASGTNISVNNGSNLTLTFVPNSGHKISQVIINGMNNTAAVSAGQHTFSNITSNQSINVNFVADVPTFTIQFLSGTSVNIPNQSAAQGSSITLPTPTRDGFTFTGWHTSNATGGVRVGGGGESYSPLAAHAGAGNVIQLSARWQENEIPIVLHTATFNSNGGSNVPTITGIPANTTINTPVAPTRSGHTFAGWYREAALTTPWNFASDVVSSDITLFAKWESISITITFDGLGGTQPNPMNFTGSPVILPNSERDGFRFVGWFTAETGGVRAGSAGEQFTPEDETQATLFARWEEENTSTFVDLLDGSHSWIGLTDDFKTGSEASLTAGADKITFNIKVGKIEGENYTWAQIMSFPGGDWSGLEEIEIKYSSQQDIVLTLIDNQGWSGAGRGFQIVLPSGNNRTQNIKWSDFGRINESASWSEFPAGSGNWIQDHKDVTPVTPSQLQHFIGVSIKPLGIEASGEISTLKLFGVIYDEESDTPTSITRPQPERSNNRYGIKFAQNPVSDNAEISVVLPNNERIAEMNVIIYDMTGNVVFDRRGRIYSTLTDDSAIVWDLRNKAGRFVANGAYLVVVEARDRNGGVYRYSARLGVRR